MKKGKENIQVIISPKELNPLECIKHFDFVQEQIYIVNNKDLYKIPYRFLTPKMMINRYCKKEKSSYTFFSIMEMLDMQEVMYVYNKKWMYIGNFKWICSVALGISMGKKIFIMPWMSKYEFEYQEYRLGKIFDAIRAINGIVIFPVEEICNSVIFEKEDVVIKAIEQL